MPRPTNTFVLVLNDATLDKMDAVYREEYARWGWRRRLEPSLSRFEVVRFDGPAADFVHINPSNCIPNVTRIESLTNRECRDKHEAAGWVRTFAGRAAIMASIQAGHDNG